KKTSLFCHERIRHGGRRYEILFDGPRRNPAPEVLRAPRFVVRARRTRAAEWLLPDDRSGGLVVDVEVPRSVAKSIHRMRDGRSIFGEKGPRERIRARPIAELERAIVFGIGIDESREHGAENLLRKERMLGIGGLDQRRLDEKSLCVGARAPGD